MKAVTSSFVDEINKVSSQPERFFFMGGSDYSDRVTKWPKIGFKIDELKSANPTVQCANDDGAFNFFFDDVFELAQDGGQKIATFGFGFPGVDSLTLYTGHLKDVKFQRNKVSFLMRDKLWNLAERVVANPTPNSGDISVVTFGDTIPSDIAWTICTCYGGLSSVASTSNPDIDYTAWLLWASVFSSNNILVSAQFDGDKCQEAISDLNNMTISTAWVDGEGRLVFRRLEAAEADDVLLDESNVVDMDVDVSDAFMVNKQWVYGNYDSTSGYWLINVNDVTSASVNSYGIKENVIKSEKVWYTDSASCIEVAQRQTLVFSDPVKRFTLGTMLQPIYIDVGDTVRLVDGFYGVTSAEAWRIAEMQTNLDKGTIRLKVENTAIGVDAFILGVSSLNDNKLLL